MKATS
jgi:hypothetical protein